MTDDTGSQPLATFEPRERRAIGVLTLIVLLRMVGLFSLLPVLALYAREFADATPLLIGMAVGGYGLTQALFQIPLGALSDRVGRLPVILGGLAVFGLGSFVAAFADSIEILIAGRLLQGAGAISAAISALIADATRVEVRTRSMAIYGGGFAASFVIAFVFGPWFAGVFGVNSLFGFGVFAAIAAAGLLFLLPRDIPRPAAVRRWNFNAAMKPELLRLDLYIFLLHAILTASFVALPFVLNDRFDMLVTQHWKIYIGAIVLSLAITIPLIFLDDRRGKGRSIGLAVVLLIVAELLLAFAGFSVWSVFIAMTVFFAGFNYLEAGLPSTLSVVAEEEARGVSMGVFSTSQFLGIFAGGLIGGRFLEGGNPGNVFFVCVLIAAIWLAMHGFGRASVQSAPKIP